MATFECTSRTNYFRVTDEERYKELFGRLCSDGGDTLKDFTKEKDGIVYHGFGAYGCIDYRDDDDNYNIDIFFEEIQKIIPNNDAFVLMESGREGLRYVSGDAVIVTSKDIISLSLANMVAAQLYKLLGEKYTPDLFY